MALDISEQQKIVACNNSREKDSQWSHGGKCRLF